MEKKTLAWAGFINGKIDLDLTIGGCEPYRHDDKIYGTIYTTKKYAKECYQDVRRIEIKEVKRKRK